MRFEEKQDQGSIPGPIVTTFMTDIALSLLGCAAAVPPVKIPQKHYHLKLGKNPKACNPHRQR